jgi:hypothetical protein
VQLEVDGRRVVRRVGDHFLQYGVATDEPSEDATTEGQRTLYGFRAVYVFDRLSHDLWPSLCALDAILGCHFRRLPR